MSCCSGIKCDVFEENVAVGPRDAWRGQIKRNLEITKTFLVAMRLRETPVPIPNTMVKT